MVAQDHRQPDGPAAPEVEILSVSQLTARIKDLLEAEFPAVWVAGEISNFKRHTSGHLYLTLKDENAALSGVMWRGRAARLRFEIDNGLEVVAFGRIGVYEPRGQYQLYIERIEPKGMGALELALRQLRQRLAAEGLFEAAHKKPLPAWPRRVALVTSPTGAAVRDMLQVFARRFPKLHILICPVHVQGEAAAGEIAAAIADLNAQSDRLGGIDVIITGRGGGSLEDLWPFNEEAVVRAIFASRIPVVSGVGHEIDVTLADLVADRRALTPTEAAELVSPDLAAVCEQLDLLRGRLTAALRQVAVAARQRLEAVAAGRVFRRPAERVQRSAQMIDELSDRIERICRHRFEMARSRLEKLAAQLEALGPTKVLARGYSITTDAESGRVLRDAGMVQRGRTVRTQLARGEIRSTVTSIQRPDP
jgi:exodeoxyribonuclease VII large subunit